MKGLIVMPLIAAIGENRIEHSKNRFCLYDFKNNGHIEKTFEVIYRHNGSHFLKVDETAYTKGCSMLDHDERTFINEYLKNAN